MAELWHRNVSSSLSPCIEDWPLRHERPIVVTNVDTLLLTVVPKAMSTCRFPRFLDVLDTATPSYHFYRMLHTELIKNLLLNHRADRAKYAQ